MSMPIPPTKVLVLGIDAANPTLLQHWAEDGTLPNLRSLIARGVVGKTRSIEGFFIGSTWPSFYTGVTPARHGFHYLVQLKPGTYDFYPPAAVGIVRCDPFWSRLSQAGRRVAVLDVPLIRLDRSINGIQVVEWGGHDASTDFRPGRPTWLRRSDPGSASIRWARPATASAGRPTTTEPSPMPWSEECIPKRT